LGIDFDASFVPKQDDRYFCFLFGSRRSSSSLAYSNPGKGGSGERGSFLLPLAVLEINLIVLEMPIRYDTRTHGLFRIRTNLVLGRPTLPVQSHIMILSFLYCQDIAF
jgi:hypothetical protein